MPRYSRDSRGERKPYGMKSLVKKVRKNTAILASREKGRIRTVVDATPDTTAVMQNISFIAQGDDTGDRHGREIHAESVSIQGSLFKATASAATTVRYMVIRDNQGTGTPPTLADIFTDENDFFQGQHRIPSEQNMKRFSILWDKFIMLNESFDGNTKVARLKFYKKLNFKITYSGTASTAEGKNSLWLLSGSNEVTNVPAVNADIVFKYTDM